MPVWVKGNQESDVFILFLHGGPGGSATIATLLPAFQSIENRYSIVYWSQRSSGIAQGNALPETFSVEEFAADLDLPVDVISKKYDNPAIFLLGHSWGGALGIAYLSDPSHQRKITGFVISDSGHNLNEGLPRAAVWLKKLRSAAD